MSYFLLIISAIFVNNIVLAQFLGICPFLGVSKKIDTSIGMSAAVMFVMTIATICTYLLDNYVLQPLNVQMVEIILKKISPSLYQALGVFLPLITTNCAILGVAILVIQKDMNLLESVVFALSTSAGFGLALVLFAGIREQLALTKLPKGIEGMPTALIVAGLLAMAFMGFSGVC